MKLLQFQPNIERLFRGRKLVKEQALKGSAIRLIRYGSRNA